MTPVTIPSTHNERPGNLAFAQYLGYSRAFFSIPPGPATMIR